MNAITQRALRNGMRRQVDVPDYGPNIRLNRGEVEKTEGPDPDDIKRTVKRAKRVVAYEVLHRAGVLTDEQREACDRYLVEAERAVGRSGRADVIGLGGADPWRAFGPSDQQLRALVSMRNVRAAIGCQYRALVDMLILENMSVRDITKRLRTGRDAVKTSLQEATTALCNHWRI
ncbi:hypothetical protein HMPREF9946_03130 [Acetobacteraceae bacterium AT-5844]|nr:hypothetical protein HMPREF9946_03130 [Acetobacteraceae bacterium AT-5844]